MNVVGDEDGKLIEVQGTAEHATFDRKQLDAMLDLAATGIRAARRGAARGRRRVTRPLVFATRNRGKLVELRELLPGIDVLVDRRGARGSAATIPEVVEDADTFAGNAAKKAREVSAATGLPALADDSGLEVDALGGAPGVYSARYAGRRRTTTPRTTRSCSPRSPACPPSSAPRGSARCSRSPTCAARSATDAITADGACEGVILDAPRGTGGFGYDPLFFVARARPDVRRGRRRHQERAVAPRARDARDASRSCSRTCSSSRSSRCWPPAGARARPRCPVLAT